MAIKHNGFTATCRVGSCEKTFTSQVATERTFITHARGARWFIGRVRATPVPRHLRHRSASRRVELCPEHSWIVLP